MRNTWGVAFVQLWLGKALVPLGEHDAATSAFAGSLTLWRELDNRTGCALSLAGLASIAAARGEAERAGRLGRTPAVVAQRISLREDRRRRKEASMEEHLLEPTPDALDGWLREHLSRRLVVVGLTLPVAGVPSRGAVTLGPPPSALLRTLEPYEEVWIRWLATGTLVDQALIRAALHEGDAVLLWLPETPTQARPASLAAFLDYAEASGARDEAVTVLAGPGSSRELARQLGFAEGFAPTATPGHIATELAREVLALEALRRGGSSPPCYL